jgi:hypothetical protein
MPSPLDTIEWFAGTDAKNLTGYSARRWARGCDDLR